MSPEVGPIDSSHGSGAGSLRRLAESAGSLGAALILGAIALRLAFLGADSFWLDEAFSVSNVLQHGVRDIWQTPVDPNHPPLYFVVLWWALHFGGVSEVVARLPSALASVCGLGLIAVLARRLGLSGRASLAAVVLLAYAPLDVWYAQEARMYAMVTTLAIAFAIALTIDGWFAALLACAVLTVGLYIDFTTVALSAMLISLWFVWWWQTGRQFRRIAFVALASLAAWLLFQPEWRHLGDVLRRIDTVPLLVNVRRWFGVRITPGFPAVALVTLISVAATIAGAILWAALSRQRFRVAWVWLVGVGFIGSTFAFSVPRGYSAKQFLATGWPFVVLVAAWTFTDAIRPARLGGRETAARWLLPLAVAASMIAAIVTVATPRADWRGVVAYLNHRTDRTAGVWLDPSWNTTPYQYYRPTLVAGTNLTQSAEAATGQFGNRGDICFVAERFGDSPPTSLSEAWLDSHLKLVETASLARLEVRCYGDPASAATR